METNKNLLLLSIIVLALSGCQSLDQVTKKFDSVRYNDGINMVEAKLVAQKIMLNSPYTDTYDVFHPHIIHNDETVKYPNFWFVTFSSNDRASVYEQIIVLDKRTGGVIRSSQYEPMVQRDFDWLIKR